MTLVYHVTSNVKNASLTSDFPEPIYYIKEMPYGGIGHRNILGGICDGLFRKAKKQNSDSKQSMDYHSPKGTSAIAKDPVCGMDVDMNTAPAKSEYKGKMYYFCAPGCKTQFDKDPERYMGK